MTDADERREPGAGQWWASWFDPVANARAFGDIQSQALRAAGDLVDRLAHAVDGPPAADGRGDDAAAAEPDGSGDAARLVERWAEILGRIARAFDPMSSAADRRVDVDLAAGSGGSLRLTWVAPGPAAGEAWLRNGGPERVGPLAIRVGELVAADGRNLDATVNVDPEKIEEMPGRSSRGLTISVAPEGTPLVGVFRALVQVDGVDATWFALEIEVPDADGAR